MKDTIIRGLGLIVILGLIFLTALFLVSNDRKALGEVAVEDKTIATSTPQLVSGTNLCPPVNLVASSTTGTLDSVVFLGPPTGSFLILDATSTDQAKRFPIATTSNILAWFPAGTPTSTAPIKYGVEFKRGLIIVGTGTTTITYRCGS